MAALDIVCLFFSYIVPDIFVKESHEFMTMEGGLIGYVRTATNGEPEPPTPFVIHVLESAGSTDEILHTADGRTWPREGLTVFATEDEATDDALRRLAAQGYEHSAAHLRFREEYREQERKRAEEVERYWAERDGDNK
jgi:hypothetical protein